MYLSQQTIQEAFFWLAVVCLLLYEYHSLFFYSVPRWIKCFLSSCQRLFQTYSDFSSGRFYRPWSTSAPVIVEPSKKHILELGENPVLSQRAAYAQLFDFRNTMNHFRIEDAHISRPRMYSRVLHLHGPKNLAAVYSVLRTRAAKFLDEEIVGGNRVRTITGDTVTLPLARMLRGVALRTMAVAFFGEKLASNVSFSEALARYPKELSVLLIALQMTPRFASGLIRRMVTKNGEAMHIIQDRVLLAIRDIKTCPNISEDSAHILSNLVLMRAPNDRITDESLSQLVLGVWFAAAHQPWMFLHFIMLELCQRPEWQTELRTELTNFNSLTYEQLEALPLLDSFIKETIRLCPLDTMVMRRQALEDFTFSSGCAKVSAGQTACISSQKILHDPGNYRNPDSFDARRFLSESGERKECFTGVTDKYPIWGLGSLACPGRYYASAVIKLAVAHLLTNFEFRLEDEHKRKKWYWETFTIPCESTKVVLERVP